MVVQSVIWSFYLQVLSPLFTPTGEVVLNPESFLNSVGKLTGFCLVAVSGKCFRVISGKLCRTWQLCWRSLGPGCFSFDVQTENKLAVAISVFSERLLRSKPTQVSTCLRRRDSTLLCFCNDKMYVSAYLILHDSVSLFPLFSDQTPHLLRNVSFVIESIQSLKQAAKQRAIIHHCVCRHRSWQKQLFRVTLMSVIYQTDDFRCRFDESSTWSPSFLSLCVSLSFSVTSRSLSLSRRLFLSVRLLGLRAALLMVEQIRAAHW